MKTKTRRQTRTLREYKEAEAQRQHDARSGNATASSEDLRRNRAKGPATTPPRDQHNTAKER